MLKGFRPSPYHAHNQPGGPDPQTGTPGPSTSRMPNTTQANTTQANTGLPSIPRKPVGKAAPQQDLRQGGPGNNRGRPSDAEVKQMVWQSLWGDGKRQWTAPYPMDEKDARVFSYGPPNRQSAPHISSTQPGGADPQHVKQVDEPAATVAAKQEKPAQPASNSGRRLHVANRPSKSRVRMKWD